MSDEKVTPTPFQKALFRAGASQQVLPAEFIERLAPTDRSIYRLASNLYDPENEIDEDKEKGD